MPSIPSVISVWHARGGDHAALGRDGASPQSEFVLPPFVLCPALRSLSRVR